MAIAVYADDQVFRALAYGSPRSEDRDYLRDHIESAAVRLGRTATAFIERSRERFESFDLRALDRKLDAIKRKVRHAFDDDQIRPMGRIGQFQQAGLNQQRWLMANVKARRLVHADRMFGWRDTYRDAEPTHVGDQHTDYRCVVNGIARSDEHGHRYFEQHFDVYDADYREELKFGDQTMIMDCMWANFEAIISDGKDDPSDPNNGSL
jgi:hypothetical protein